MPADVFSCVRCLYGPESQICTFIMLPDNLPCKLCGGTYPSYEIQNACLSPLPQRTKICPACAADRHCCQFCLCDLTEFVPKAILIPGSGALTKQEVRDDVRRAAVAARRRKDLSDPARAGQQIAHLRAPDIP